MPETILYTENLMKCYEKSNFFSKKRLGITAVDGVSMRIYRGETLGLVGESGCGKSTLGHMLVRLLEPTSGRIYFKGIEVTTLSGKELKKYRQNAQIIFQDPLSFLNPRMNIFELVSEPLLIHKLLTKSQIALKVKSLLDKVGLGTIDVSSYPHQLSGGQLQRVGIARALSINPEIVICDEPVSSLDVSIQSQIINLLSDLQNELGLTYLFISHNLAVVKNIADRVAVMYLGNIVELSTADAFFQKPLHPYSRLLLEAVPEPNPRIRRGRSAAVGEISGSLNIINGCPFHPRCPQCMEKCRTTVPELRPDENTCLVACHIY